MKRPIVHLSLLLGLWTAVAFSQDAAGPVPSNDGPPHDAIRELRDALIAAVNGKDIDTLTSLLHEDVILTAQDGDELATIRGRDGVRDYIDRLLTGPDAKVKEMTVRPVVDDLTILHGEDTGIAYGRSTDDYTMMDGSEFTLEPRWSATVIKGDDGNWLLGNLHVSSNLFDNPVVDALKRYLLFTGIAAGLGGVLIGYLGARLIGRSRARHS